jgi:DNA-directed RNA polymerase specialized sigma24 family protein
VPDTITEKEAKIICLEHCMERTPPENRDFILQYFQEERHPKVDHRKNLADKLGITVSALRMRVHRAKADLKKCIEECLEQKSDD